MEADTPRRSATAPTFSDSPTFPAECDAFFLRALTLEFESEEEGLDKDLTSEYISQGLGPVRIRRTPRLAQSAPLESTIGAYFAERGPPGRSCLRPRNWSPAGCERRAHPEWAADRETRENPPRDSGKH